MSRTVTAGLDGSRESLAAAAWAAREATLRGLPLRLVHVRETVPLMQAPFIGGETGQWSEPSDRIPREAAELLLRRHPGLDISWEQLDGRPSEILPEAAEESDLLVLGSRGLGSLGGFLLGSVGQAVVARTERPVVLVRAPETGDDDGDGDGEADAAASGTAAEPPAATGPVVLGLDANAPDDALIAFAFEAAVRGGTSLRVVHSWNLPPYFAYGLPPDPELNAQLADGEARTLAGVLEPWLREHPSLDVVAEARPGKAVDQLVDASRDASLLVVGRRIRRATPFGGRIGSVAHAVLHHAAAPVAVIPHR
ncbi:universal stress protein [Streptomyces sp. NPDC014894]|uniref:universal stress protein n=1 Tax=Streptomyces sp. NPDC014894 TaxID=3364931 RepID=UPI0036F9140D